MVLSFRPYHLRGYGRRVRCVKQPSKISAPRGYPQSLAELLFPAWRIADKLTAQLTAQTTRKVPCTKLTSAKLTSTKLTSVKLPSAKLASVSSSEKYRQHSRYDRQKQ